MATANICMQLPSMVRVPSSVTKIMKCDDGSRHGLCTMSEVLVSKLTSADATPWDMLHPFQACSADTHVFVVIVELSMDVKFQLMPFPMAEVWAEKCLY